MQYFVYIRRRGRLLTVRDSVLPGIIPEHVMELMTADSARDVLGICDGCESSCNCHVMRLEPARSNRHGCGDVYSHLCPILFHDVFKPLSWSVAELS